MYLYTFVTSTGMVSEKISDNGPHVGKFDLVSAMMISGNYIIIACGYLCSSSKNTDNS